MARPNDQINRLESTKLRGNLIVQGVVWAAGTTKFHNIPAGWASAGSGSGTNLDSLQGKLIVENGIYALNGITAASTIVSGTTIKAGTSVQGNTGFVFANSAIKQFAAGTYIGTGGATAAITSTGLTTIHMIWMQLNKAAYSSATTGMAYTRPCVAAGTVGSFYPIAFKTGTIGGGGPVLNTVAGTFRWLAIGAKTLT